MEPVRAFEPIGNKTELVLTFVTAANNVYYSVIETNWTDAPILRHLTSKRHDPKTGRTFGLYTVAGAIQMIV